MGPSLLHADKDGRPQVQSMSLKNGREALLRPPELLEGLGKVLNLRIIHRSGKSDSENAQ